MLSKGWAIPVLTIVYTGAAARDLDEALLGQVAEGPLGVDRSRPRLGGLVAVTQLAKVGATGLTLVLVGGLFYSVGGIVYALKRPDPRPAVLGYHELFHLCTIAAAACQYVAIAFFVLPRG